MLQNELFAHQNDAPEENVKKVTNHEFDNRNIAAMTKLEFNETLHYINGDISYYTLRKKKVNPHNFTVLLEPRHLCQSDTFLLLIIPSMSINRVHRAVIRSTWGRLTEWPTDETQGDIQRLFLLAKSENDHGLIKESKEFNDLLQEDFIDSYNNLTKKTVMGLKWAVKNCQNAKYTLKVDQDVFVHIPRIVRILLSGKYRTSIGGLINRRMPAQREGDWSISPSMFPFPFYPHYAAGCAYVIPSALIAKLVRNFEYMPYVHFEDVFITGILAKVSYIGHVDLNGIVIKCRKMRPECQFYRNNKTAVHGVSTQLMRNIWKSIQGNDSNCLL